MAKPEYELVQAVDSLAFGALTIPQGTLRASDDPFVRSNAQWFVPLSAGQEAVTQRRAEIERARIAHQTAADEARRREIINQGTKPLPSDDANAEAAKAMVRANKDLELVYDASTGIVVGARHRG